MLVLGITQEGQRPVGFRGQASVPALRRSEPLAQAALWVGIATLGAVVSLCHASIALAQRDGMSFGIHGRTYAGMRHGSASVRTVHMDGGSSPARTAMGFHSGGDVHQRTMQSMDSFESRLVASDAVKARLQRGMSEAASTASTTSQAAGGRAPQARESATQRTRRLAETRVKAAEAHLSRPSAKDGSAPWWVGAASEAEGALRSDASGARSRDAHARSARRVVGASRGRPSDNATRAHSRDDRTHARELSLAPVKRTVTSHAWLAH